MKNIPYFLIGIAALVGLFFLMSQPPKDINSFVPNFEIPADFANYDLIFYWGNGCPHCENVEAWLSENNQDNQLKINSKEINQNKDNQVELFSLASTFCPEVIQDGGIGVPTSFDPVTQKCIQGDTPIIEFLSDKLKQ